ncbi:MAG: HNH/ENDO VII family nuclease, partial [Caldilineaceae bacterium]|nr:HNH/ENDO VII family nuclease [Caldilineaceae bacterium]
PYGQHYSPYLAMSNNPVSFVDPDGGYDGYWVDGIQVFGFDMADLMLQFERSGGAFDLAIYTTDANGRLSYGEDLYNVIMEKGNLKSANYTYAQMVRVAQASYPQPDGSISIGSTTIFRDPHTGRTWAEANGVVAMSRRQYGTIASRLQRLHQVAEERDSQHFIADIAGFAPGIGEAADILNIGLYIRDGDYNSAGWSTLAVIPGAGVLATLYKWSKRADKAVGAAHALRRPYIRKSVRQAVEDAAPRAPDGRFIDPNTLLPIDGKPHLGHKFGNEFWREAKQAQEEGLTQKQFNNRMNDPSKYQLEDPASNRSHRYEKKD